MMLGTTSDLCNLCYVMQERSEFDDFFVSSVFVCEQKSFFYNESDMLFPKVIVIV